MLYIGIMKDQRDLTVKGEWLTDPTVPKARPVWGRRQGRLFNHAVKAWIPKEDTMWLDLKTGIVYCGISSKITDFSSTPVGDGHMGVLRGAGRLHDLMTKDTPVLLPNYGHSPATLLERLGARKSYTIPSVSFMDVIESGYRKGSKHKSGILLWIFTQ